MQFIEILQSELFVKIRTTGPSFYIVKPNGIKIKPGDLSIFEITLRKRSKALKLLKL